MRSKLVVVIALASALVVCGRSMVGAQLPAMPPQPWSHTLEVSGHGETRATPDLALLNLAVETRGANAEEAAGRNAKLSQKVIQALRAKLGGQGKVSTGGYNLFPDYSNQPSESRPKIIGYRAENSIDVETGALDRVGALIDAAIAAGANRINSLSFVLREETSARNEAIARAAKDAQAQAQALASALGVKLKGIVRATTESGQRPIPVMANRLAAMAAAPTPIEPGEVTVPATVSVTYAIQ